MKKCRLFRTASALICALSLLSGCGAVSGTAASAVNSPAGSAPGSTASASLSAREESSTVTLTAEHPGTLTAQCDEAVIDYSNLSDGYVMMCYTAQTDKRLKAQVKGPETVYTYNLTPQVWAAFPLSDGNGDYSFVVYENVEGDKYAAVLSQDCTVTMTDEFAPFLRPNQYVNYADAPQTRQKARELTAGLTDELSMVAAVYDWVIANISYDSHLAETVQSGYLPELDKVLASGKGICFDYAALMAGMLRSRGVPCKLVIGYAGEVYHAWLNVWVDGVGWVNNAVYFNGTDWERMDPTFAATAQNPGSINRYIGDGANYTAKYFY